LGIWSVEQVKKNEVRFQRWIYAFGTTFINSFVVHFFIQPKTKAYEKAEERTVDIQISEIRNGNNFFFRVVGDESAQVIDNSMKIFTETNGTLGAPCDIKVGKVVAALFNDGSSNAWYRAKIIEKLANGKVKVLFVDHGNVATVKAASQCRPLDVALSTESIPAVAKEGQLAMTKVRSVTEDDGIEAARYFQHIAWGKTLKARLHGESDGKVLVTLYESDTDAPSINENIVAEGLAIMGKKYEVYEVLDRMGNSDSLGKLVKDLRAAQEKAKSSRKGMWVYGEIPEEDEE
jgi:staphylococcal nuclease domain-containing protein 1